MLGAEVKAGSADNARGVAGPGALNVFTGTLAQAGAEAHFSRSSVSLLGW
jgi:hypothetical protein